ASFVLNGFGKTAGLVQVDELGVLESPIMLTNTFSVAAVLQGTMDYMLAENPAIGDSTSSLNIVVGECNDSYLNSMRRM
ncbi:P1 family peptidase, partial [Bacillus sp. SIMBA_161]